MMLRRAGTVKVRQVSTFVDEYVPLQVEFEPRVVSVEESYYWRSTNSNYLLEFKVHASDGAVAEIRVVLVPKGRVREARSVRDLCGTAGTTFGLPLIDTALWKKRIGPKEIGIDPALRRYDEKLGFSYSVADDGVAILFDGVACHSSIQCGPVRFVFSDQDELGGVLVQDAKIAERARSVLI